MDFRNSLEEIAEREIFWIKELETFGNSKKGYNMTPGGEGVTQMDEETKNRHRQATIDAMNVPEIREKMIKNLTLAMSTPEAKKKNSDAQKIAQNNPTLKKKWEERNKDPNVIKMLSEKRKQVFLNPEVKKRHREACKKFNVEKKAKQIHQIMNGEIITTFESIIEASRSTGINKNCIGRCANGNLRTSGGYVWKYKIS